MSKPKDPPATEGDELLGNGASSATAEGDNAPDGAGTNNGGQDNGGNNTPPPDEKKDGEKKMGLVTFIQTAEPNKYVISILKIKHGMEAHTKAEWEQIVKNLLNKKVS